MKNTDIGYVVTIILATAAITIFSIILLSRFLGEPVLRVVK